MPSDAHRRPHLAEIATDLIDDQVGIVRLAGAAPRQSGTPSFFHYWALAADTRAFTEQRNFARAGGSAEDPDRALAKAIGEAVERYCAAIYRKEELPLRTAEEAEFPVVDPAAFALNAASQYAENDFWLVPFDRETPVRWVPAVDALSNETRYVPAAMVYVPYYYAERGEPPIAQPISTGLSCHASFHEAAAVSLAEVVERDAFTIVWQARIAPPRIVVDSLPPELWRLHQRFDSAGFEVTLFDITLDNLIPTVLAVSRHRSRDCPAVVVAASASLDPARATRSALEELAHTGHYCQEIVRELPRLAPDAPVVDQESHLNYWCDHANAGAIEFLYASSTEIAYGDLEEAHMGDAANDLRELCTRIVATGHRALLCDLTTSDVAALDLAVVRAVVPGYQPLVSGHRYRALGGRRLWEVPQRLGYPGISTQNGDNPLPHAYP